MKDTKETLICPACGEKMEKIKAPESDFYIDICTNGCGGMYFDNRELEKLDEKSENVDFIFEALKGKTFKPATNNDVRICPACGSNMVKNFASTKREIEIDCCYTCGGKFLDYGELEKLRNQYETEADRSDDFMEDFMKIHGAELKKTEMEANKLASERSFFRKMFLSVYEKF